MRLFVTGSSGHLGEALLRLIAESEHDAIGLDRVAGAYTTHVGSIGDAPLVAELLEGCDAVLHTATLHKPHVATHAAHQFVDTNIRGTLTLLEAAVEAAVPRFIFTSTTSAFGRALTPAPGEPAAWLTERARPSPKNIYGTTKVAAEDLCELYHYRKKLACIVLRTSRFFPEDDDNEATRRLYPQLNAKVNELLHRRVDLEDAAHAHLCALERATDIGFGRYIVSATTPFEEADCGPLRVDAPSQTERRVPHQALYQALGWRMFPSLDRVYVNTRARRELGWQPRHDFASAVQRMANNEWPFSELTRIVGAKGYHEAPFDDGPYPVEPAAD